jgi:hypothetical protein
MKLTDGRKTVDITICRWNGSGWDPDWSQDYFAAGTLPYDEETGCHYVPDVDYCIEMAKDSTCDDGACYGDEDMCVFVEEL